MSRDSILEAFSKLRRRTGGHESQTEKAPHKPLLVLYALGRLRHGEDRLSFAASAGDLDSLLQDFGSGRGSGRGPEFPFWRLQKDHDHVWEVTWNGPAGDQQPSRSQLVDGDCRGGFSVWVLEELRNDAGLATELATRMLENFPAEQHGVIRERVGLSESSEARLNYWITTHWPPRPGNEELPARTGVWVPEGREQAANGMKAGDQVLIYETKSGRTEIRKFQDGTTKQIACRRGKEGLIAYGNIESPISAIPDSKPTIYVDGTEIWWRWYAPVSILSRSGFVGRDKVMEELGYKPSYNLRGFGDYKSGLKRISESQFNALVAKFHDARPVELPKKDESGGHGQGGGGESEVHLNLKKYVAANPSTVLKEAGLRCLGVEYEFPTNDRADIVLVDAHKRIVGVEIEPAVNDSELAGPLQAIKYRYMLECATNRARGDSRAMLIAHSISAGIKKLCASYNIECYEIAPEDVTACP